jgi:hypothetical protein
MRPLSIIQKGKEVRAERVELQPSTDSHSALVEHVCVYVTKWIEIRCLMSSMLSIQMILSLQKSDEIIYSFIYIYIYIYIYISEKKV